MNVKETIFNIRNIGGIWLCYREGVDSAVYSALSREEIIKRTITLANVNSPSKVILHNSDGSTETKFYL